LKSQSPFKRTGFGFMDDENVSLYAKT
jgi:hypothetical protein